MSGHEVSSHHADCNVPSFWPTRHLLKATSWSSSTAELTALAEALDGSKFLTLVVNGYISSLTPSTLRGSPSVSRMLRGMLPWPTHVMTHVLRSKGRFHISVHHVFSLAGNARNECADVAASPGLKGFISENNVPLFLAYQNVSSAALVERSPLPL